MDKMTHSQSYLIAETHQILYDGLVNSYKLDKDLFESYGSSVMLKHNYEDDDDQDKDPPVGSDQGFKRRKTTTSSKSGKSVKEHVKEPVNVMDHDDVEQANDAENANTKIPMDHGDSLGNTNDQPNMEDAPKNDWYKKSNRDPSPDPKWIVGKLVDDEPA
ncbi:hypothetical protein Tco_0797154 [Tanacetum coccineum]